MSWSPRTGGLARLFAAGLLVLSAVLHAISPFDADRRTWSDNVYRAVVLVAFLAVIGAIAGIHAGHRRRPRYGWVGTVAAGTTSAGVAVVAAVTAIGMARDAGSLQAVRIAGAALVLVGSAALGVVVIVARLVPRWCGVLLIVAFPLGDIADDIFRTGENLLLALLWGSVGLALLSLAPQPARIREPGSGAVVPQRSTMTG